MRLQKEPRRLLVDCFNPRTREECDYNARMAILNGAVSIHALVKSATRKSLSHAQHHGCFNPRTREECDSGCWRFMRLIWCFNPRTREECDRRWRARSASSDCFNPRTREECDHRRPPRSASSDCFNPRTREECDLSHLSTRSVLLRFQSTHS